MKKALVLVLLLGVVFGGFAKGLREEGGRPARGVKTGGVLVFGRSGDAVGLDPAREDDGESFYIADNVYETLVEFKPGTTEVQPALAEDWDVSDDGLEFTFELRKGVKFHDGTDFTADAVVFSLSRQFKEDHPHYNYGPWKLSLIHI